jgi:hypothetical protein
MVSTSVDGNSFMKELPVPFALKNNLNGFGLSSGSIRN